MICVKTSPHKKNDGDVWVIFFIQPLAETKKDHLLSDPPKIIWSVENCLTFCGERAEDFWEELKSFWLGMRGEREQKIQSKKKRISSDFNFFTTAWYKTNHRVEKFTFVFISKFCVLVLRTLKHENVYMKSKRFVSYFFVRETENTHTRKYDSSKIQRT